MTIRLSPNVTAGTAKTAIDLVAAVAMATAAIVLIWRTSHQTGAPPRPRSQAPAIENVEQTGLTTILSKMSRRGRADAPVILIEFSDFECPFCASYIRDTYDRIDREFVANGTVQYAFRNFPLETIHKSALEAAQAAECAGAQGKFWEMHRRLFEKQAFLGGRVWLREAPGLNLDVDTFAACLAGTTMEKVRSDIDEGARLGVTSTPMFLIGRVSTSGIARIIKRIRGAQPFDVFQDHLRRVLDDGPG